MAGLQRCPAIRPGTAWWVTVSDVAGHNSAEACGLSSIRAANQRILLHRSRAALRAVLERHWIKEATA